MELRHRSSICWNGLRVGCLDHGINAAERAFRPLGYWSGLLSIQIGGSSSNALITEQFGDPYNLPQYPRASGAVVPGRYYSRADGGGTFSKDFLAYIQYSNGPLNLGILGSYGSYHIGPEALIDDPNDPLVARLVPQDSEIFHGTAFVKYKTGAFSSMARLHGSTGLTGGMRTLPRS